MLKDKVAYVTGSTRGIGWNIARLFAQQGASVVLNGCKDEKALFERAEQLNKEFGVETLALFGDVADSGQVKESYRKIFERFKRLDILVNNAGVLGDHLLGMIPDEEMRRIFDINVMGTLFNLQAATRLMMRKKSGSIINMSSIVGRVGNEGQVVYAGSKAAVIGITQSAAKELAPHGIRVNAIAPGFIDTDMTRAIPEEKFEERIKSIKSGRVGTPEDIAQATLFLASDHSSYVCGQILGVDGGMLI